MLRAWECDKNKVNICSFEGKEVYCDYYISPGKPGKVFVKCGVPCETESFYLFEIVDEGGLFVIKIKDFENDSEKAPRFMMAGESAKTAAGIMIEEIVKTTISNRFEDPMDSVKETLVKALETA